MPESYLVRVADRIRREMPDQNPTHETYLEGSGELLTLLYRMLGPNPPRIAAPERAYVEHALQTWLERDYADRWVCWVVIVPAAEQLLGQRVIESALG